MLIYGTKSTQNGNENSEEENENSEEENEHSEEGNENSEEENDNSEEEVPISSVRKDLLSHNRLPPIFNSKDRNEWRREIEEIKSTFKLSVMPKWELKDVIGRGGFGTVFRVPTPERNGQLWAVKRVVRRESQIEPEKDGVIREIVTSAGLSQVKVISVGLYR